MTIRRTAEDPEGRRVDLTQERWEHICDAHPELAPLEDIVLDTVRELDPPARGSRPERALALGGVRRS